MSGDWPSDFIVSIDLCKLGRFVAEIAGTRGSYTLRPKERPTPRGKFASAKYTTKASDAAIRTMKRDQRSAKRAARAALFAVVTGRAILVLTLNTFVNLDVNQIFKLSIHAKANPGADLSKPNAPCCSSTTRAAVA